MHVKSFSTRLWYRGVCACRNQLFLNAFEKFSITEKKAVSEFCAYFVTLAVCGSSLARIGVFDSAALRV